MAHVRTYCPALRNFPSRRTLPGSSQRFTAVPPCYRHTPRPPASGIGLGAVLTYLGVAHNQRMRRSQVEITRLMARIDEGQQTTLRRDEFELFRSEFASSAADTVYGVVSLDTRARSVPNAIATATESKVFL